MGSTASHSITLVAPPDDVDAVHQLLAEVWVDFPSVSTVDRTSFETALIELASNVIRHAGGGAAVRCDLTVSIVGGVIEARLTDGAAPSNADLVARGMPDALSEQGRGIPLIQLLVDEVEYIRSESVNHWRISRRLRP